LLDWLFLARRRRVRTVETEGKKFGKVPYIEYLEV
jgi:hypothetical protein